MRESEINCSFTLLCLVLSLQRWGGWTRLYGRGSPPTEYALFRTPSNLRCLHHPQNLVRAMTSSSLYCAVSCTEKGLTYLLRYDNKIASFLYTIYLKINLIIYLANCERAPSDNNSLNDHHVHTAIYYLCIAWIYALHEKPLWRGTLFNTLLRSPHFVIDSIY